jgi:hypothetical protein
MKSVNSLCAAIAASAALLLCTPTGFAQSQKQLDRDNKMSSAGKRAGRGRDGARDRQRDR